jgi:DNA topoisomerase VI subunit B
LAAFLNPDRLPQKAGWPHGRLRPMILKELTDNALDTGAAVVLERIDDDTWSVADQGPGLEREQVVRYFAVDRPMTSTKLVRRPTRGAIGNGLRVVTAASWRVVVALPCHVHNRR